ncbi:hypothetical protein D3C87_95180 [compost metagenome]
MKKMTLIAGSFLLFLVFSACSKHRARKLAGTYHCQVNYGFYSMGQGAKDSTYFEDVTVTRKGKELSVMKATFDVEKVENGKTFQIGTPDNSMSVVFKEDSLIIWRRFGGLGSSTTLLFRGTK